jgi:hypothetical protein
MGILKVCESKQSFVGNFDWAFAWSFAVRGKKKESKKSERKEGIVSVTLSRALEA